MKLLLILILITPIYSEVLKIGNEIPKLEFETQREDKDTLNSDIKYLVFTSEMEASKIAHSLFEKEGDAYLKKYFIFFISDIHKMPSLITKFIALPKMRNYKYTIHLIKEENQNLEFPIESGKLTILQLKNLKIISINFAKNETELINLIEK
jgi:hypothetical protein